MVVEVLDTESVSEVTPTALVVAVTPDMVMLLVSVPPPDNPFDTDMLLEQSVAVAAVVAEVALPDKAPWKVVAPIVLVDGLMKQAVLVPVSKV